MDRFFAGKLKRRDLDELHDEFAEFSLFSPARKIRRLDVELPSIVEEDDLAVPVALDSEMLMEEMTPSSGLQKLVVPAVPYSSCGNDNRALVLYKPMENPLLVASDDPHVSFTVSSDFMQGLRNHIYKPADQSLFELDEKSANKSNCLAVVPWVPSHAIINSSGFSDSELRTQLMEEPTEDDELEAASMEVEEFKEQEPDNVVTNESMQQWQQQHWLVPDTSGPVMWS